MASELRKKVKIELIQRGMLASELAEIVNKQLGYKIDSSYINKVLDGKYNSPKVTDAVCQALDIKQTNGGGGKKSARVRVQTHTGGH